MASLPYFVAMFEGRAVTIKRDADYKTTMKYVQKAIPKLRSANTQNISISTTLPECGDMLVQISEETWPDLVDSVKTAEITVDQADPALSTKEEITTVATMNPVARSTSHPHDTTAQIKRLQNVINPAGKSVYSATYRFSVIVRTTQELLKLDHFAPAFYIRSITELVESKYGLPAALQKLGLLGNSLDDAQTLDQCGITDGTIVDLAPSTRKSAIYFLSPHGCTPGQPTLKNVKVELALNQAWELVTLVPSKVQEYKGFIRSASWIVDVADDGTLLDHGSNTKLDCLFWEGIQEAYRSLQLSQCLTTKLSHPYAWMKAIATVEPENSSVVPLPQVESYISAVLSTTGFEFNSKFLNLFMPQLKSKPWTHIALRFLPQAESEALSYLNITPSPQRTIHITMLYKGLSDLDDLTWGTSLLSLAEGSDTWRDTVGANPVESADRSVFSVYEITWMEIF